MAEFVVLLADVAPSRVNRGETLARFLRLFAPATRQLDTPALRDAPAITCDVAFIGLPSALTAADLERLTARRFVTFDYFDEPEPCTEWPAAQADPAWRRDLAPLHLKTHILDAAPTHDGLRLGVLPIKYNKAVTTAWWKHRLSRLVRGNRREWDVSLHGSATYLPTPGTNGRGVAYDQRIDWLRELRTHPEWRRWGGLVDLPYRTAADIVRDHGPDAAALFDTGPRMPFGEYFRRMTDTRVALCPTGHARWTYRHVESVYAGCSIVSTDLRGIRTLVPAPLEHLRLVADRAPIGPAVAEALDQFEAEAHRRAGALEHLERWLSGGRFAGSRPRAFATFVDQLG